MSARPTMDALLKIIERIPHCGCGDPDAAYRYVRWLMRQASKPTPLTEDVVGVTDDDGLYWFVLYAMETIGLMEHGTSARCGWLTADGKTLLAAWNHVHDDRLAEWCLWVFDSVYNPGQEAKVDDWSQPAAPGVDS